MAAIRIVLKEIAPEGRTITVDDPAVWAAPLAEFHLPCRVLRPLSAEVFLLPQEEGCLIRGRIRGEVALPCTRCAEDSVISLDQAFEEFEEYPDSAPDFSMEETGAERDLLEDDSVIQLENGVPVLDLSALLWEEFSLALPIKPLCAPDCQGVCPTCGKNLNEGPCGCSSDEGDPRLAALRQLKVSS